MKLGLINSAWVQSGRPTSFGLQQTKAIGFDCIDIFTDPLDLDARERRLIRDECRALDLPIVSLPCVAVGLVDLNPSVRAFHESRVAAFLDLAYDYAARNVLLVLGEYIWNREVIPPAEQWGWAVDAVRRLGSRAAGLDLEIVLELEPFPLSLVRDVETMAHFLDDVNVPAVKANIDISHLVLSRVKPEELRRLRGRVGHVHLSDCDGRVHGDLPPGRGVVPFAPYLREIAELGIEGAISIELEYSPQPERIVEWVEEAYRATARLMAEAGLRPTTKSSGQPHAMSVRT
ncbi:MAG TPA: sugar phosphate isomerase/epimerase [Pirellulales bacterium]|nr:sugar phosphate isomerase/epimerase [Pirellulales bacterium]